MISFSFQLLPLFLLATLSTSRSFSNAYNCLRSFVKIYNAVKMLDQNSYLNHLLMSSCARVVHKPFFFSFSLNDLLSLRMKSTISHKNSLNRTKKQQQMISISSLDLHISHTHIYKYIKAVSNFTAATHRKKFYLLS